MEERDYSSDILNKPYKIHPFYFLLKVSYISLIN